ncbi:hypothetical protein NPIL_205871 [Nephila pilipes]|uniref:Uncharacterized protein n=1 Tax=Nephila pilipes TaxID=299642 RepID=A0A8X6PJ11_NEPPI|nr:hypothetical protein NPIL_205871 [Nephila pilipes]
MVSAFPYRAPSPANVLYQRSFLIQKSLQIQQFFQATKVPTIFPVDASGAIDPNPSTFLDPANALSPTAPTDTEIAPDPLAPLPLIQNLPNPAAAPDPAIAVYFSSAPEPPAQPDSSLAPLDPKIAPHTSPAMVHILPESL